MMREWRQETGRGGVQLLKFYLIGRTKNIEIMLGFFKNSIFLKYFLVKEGADGTGTPPFPGWNPDVPHNSQFSSRKIMIYQTFLNSQRFTGLVPLLVGLHDIKRRVTWNSVCSPFTTLHGCMNVHDGSGARKLYCITQSSK